MFAHKNETTISKIEWDEQSIASFSASNKNTLIY